VWVTGIQKSEASYSSPIPRPLLNLESLMEKQEGPGMHDQNKKFGSTNYTLFGCMTVAFHQLSTLLLPVT